MNRLAFMFNNALNYNAGERVCIIRDKYFESLTNRITKYCKDNNIPLEEILFNSTNGDITPEVKNSFLSDSNDILFLASKNNLWHTPERKEAKYSMGKRLINLLHPEYPCASYSADISQMNSLGNVIRNILEKGTTFRIVTDEGTDLVAKIGKVFCETGDYTKPKSGGDYPAGEVGFGPVINSVNGRLVYNYKIQHLGNVCSEVIDVNNDKISFLLNSKEYINLINSHFAFSYISEISLGLNPIWSESSNVHSIIEEKNLGTVHIGHGGNLSYGDRIGPHFDAVIKNPIIYIDNVMLIDRGRLIL